MKHLAAAIYGLILVAITISLGLMIVATALLFAGCVWLGERGGAFKQAIRERIKR